MASEAFREAKQADRTKRQTSHDVQIKVTQLNNEILLGNPTVIKQFMFLVEQKKKNKKLRPFHPFWVNYTSNSM